MSETRPISVTELSRRLGRSGDLRTRDFSLLRGVDGIRTHQSLQRNRGAGFQAEVSISTVWEDWRIQGRIDGVETTGGEVILEEIKTTRDPEGDAAQPDPVHLLQLQFYGWMWAREHEQVPRLRLRYALPQGEVCEVEVQPRSDIDALLREFQRRQADLQAWREKRNQALRDLSFPFAATRPGQQEILDAVSETFATGSRLLVEAPTGIGKTLAVLTPALRALGQGKVGRLYLATCRNAGKNTIEDSLRTLTASLPGLRALTLQARDRVTCRNGEACDVATCSCSIGFYDRLEEGLEALRQEPTWDTPTWRRIADAYDLNPFAFSLEAAREADVLIGDINFALDPAARLEFFFGEQTSEVGFILDEAHHLPDRARSMLSASLHPGEIRAWVRGCAADHRSLIRKDLDRVLREMRNYVNDAVASTGWPLPDADPPHRLVHALTGAIETLELSLAGGPPVADDPRLEIFRAFQTFRGAVGLGLPAQIPFVEQKRLHWFCADPSDWVREQLDGMAASALFSATLSPLEAFRAQTGLGTETRSLEIGSPFDPAHFTVRIDPSLSLAYRDRTPETLFRLSERIASLLSEDRKNTLVFFPSYALLEEVHRRMPPADLLMDPVRMQPRGLQEQEARAFLEPFFASDQAGAVFAVLGGALNEGIDLPGAALSRVIVVSVGYPAVCMERELIRAQVEQLGGDGFRLAYELPGLIRIRQAMGRVIRGPEDVGEAWLLDERFTRPGYAILGASGSSLEIS